MVGSAADQPAAAALEAVGEAVMNNLFTECFSVSALLALVEPNPNRAPIGVFIALGVVITLISVALYFANSVGGGEHDHWYGDPLNNYCGSFGGVTVSMGGTRSPCCPTWVSGYGPFGSFTHL